MDWPLGVLGIRVSGRGLSGIDFLPAARRVGVPIAPEYQAMIEQLRAYFRDPSFRFSLRLALEGTEFERRVWAALRRIPAGTTVTYGTLAIRLGSAPRAVGRACGANPVPIVIPCHRVVAADGLGGYMGANEHGLDVKRWLLDHERARARA
ncbi:MAG: methylated-DNA--[protein]-cysteine S-methyltransferase [Gammaproteobacteria bacterium]